MIEIVAARFPADLPTVRSLFRAYADGLGIDLSFQSFDEELAGLPGKYAGPGGSVLLAWEHGQAVGCVAMRALTDSTCEMKRLYVSDAGRGQGLGHRLAAAICRDARMAGYAFMRLDTLTRMVAARRVYASLGFVPIAPYGVNPIEDAVYLECDLRTVSE